MGLPDGHYRIKYLKFDDTFDTGGSEIISGPMTKEEAVQFKEYSAKQHSYHGINCEYDMRVRKNGNWHHMHHATGEATEHRTHITILNENTYKLPEANSMNLDDGSLNAKPKNAEISVGKMLAYPGDNNPNSKLWYVGLGFGKSSTGSIYPSESEAKAAADKLNRQEESINEHREWSEKQSNYITSGDARRAAMSRRDTAPTAAPLNNRDAEAEHSFREGDSVTASAAYGGQSGVVIGTQGRSYVMVQHADDTESIYHCSDISASSELDQQELEDEDEIWTATELRVALNDIGYEATEIPVMITKLDAAPAVKTYLMGGVISAREDLESVLMAASRNVRQKELSR